LQPGKQATQVSKSGRTTKSTKPGCDLVTPGLSRSIKNDTCAPHRPARQPRQQQAAAAQGVCYTCRATGNLHLAPGCHSRTPDLQHARLAQHMPRRLLAHTGRTGAWGRSTFMLRCFSTSPCSHISSSSRSDHLMCTSLGAYRCPMSATLMAPCCAPPTPSATATWPHSPASQSHPAAPRHAAPCPRHAAPKAAVRCHAGTRRARLVASGSAAARAGGVRAGPGERGCGGTRETARRWRRRGSRGASGCRS
jgi:hypothetical protein